MSLPAQYGDPVSGENNPYLHPILPRSSLQSFISPPYSSLPILLFYDKLKNEEFHKMQLAVSCTTTTSLNSSVVNTVLSTMNSTWLFIYLLSDSLLFKISILTISVLECMTGRRSIKNNHLQFIEVMLIP